MTLRADGPAISDRAFACCRNCCPQQLLSRAMHRLRGSKMPVGAPHDHPQRAAPYPMIELREAANPDPFSYPSFNAFFTRALRPGCGRWQAASATDLTRDGTLSHDGGTVREGQLLQAKGMYYTASAFARRRVGRRRVRWRRLSPASTSRRTTITDPPPTGGRLTATRYVPGRLFSVNAATGARTFQAVSRATSAWWCEFDTELGPLAV